jgi:hypothetical protein
MRWLQVLALFVVEFIALYSIFITLLQITLSFHYICTETLYRAIKLLENAPIPYNHIDPSQDEVVTGFGSVFG